MCFYFILNLCHELQVQSQLTNWRQVTINIRAECYKNQVLKEPTIITEYYRTKYYKTEYYKNRLVLYEPSIIKPSITRTGYYKNWVL